jgi:hypothetical protein
MRTDLTSGLPTILPELPTTPFLGSCPEIDGAASGSAVPMSLFRGSHRIAQNRSAWEFPVVSVKELTD